MVGAFAIDNDFSGIVIMVCLGAIAYVLEESGFPIAPIVLGIVLGKLVEQNLMQSLVSAQGDLLVFFQRPISAVLGIATIAVWSVTLLRWAQRSMRAAEQRHG
jgi:TctA family transporter